MLLLFHAIWVLKKLSDRKSDEITSYKIVNKKILFMYTVNKK